ncbi:MAG: hypothetical protein PHT12_05810 [Patescibacteria group bacterium]|nr:hypothetical protein [Patescibacteria group bacterium]
MDMILNLGIAMAMVSSMRDDYDPNEGDDLRFVPCVVGSLPMAGSWRVGNYRHQDCSPDGVEDALIEYLDGKYAEDDEEEGDEDEELEDLGTGHRSWAAREAWLIDSGADPDLDRVPFAEREGDAVQEEGVSPAAAAVAHIRRDRASDLSWEERDALLPLFGVTVTTVFATESCVTSTYWDYGLRRLVVTRGTRPVTRQKRRLRLRRGLDRRGGLHQSRGERSLDLTHIGSRAAVTVEFGGLTSKERSWCRVTCWKKYGRGRHQYERRQSTLTERGLTTIRYGLGAAYVRHHADAVSEWRAHGEETVRQEEQEHQPELDFQAGVEAAIVARDTDWQDHLFWWEMEHGADIPDWYVGCLQNPEFEAGLEPLGPCEVYNLESEPRRFDGDYIFSLAPGDEHFNCFC